MTTSGSITGIILAAGMSTRLGRPKQLLKVGGEFIINRVVDAALNSGLEKIIVVLGHRHREIQVAMGARLTVPRLKVVINRDYRRGQSHSLRCGVQAIRSDCAACMFMVADQPLLDAGTIDLLIERFRLSASEICVPLCRGKRQSPTLFSSRYYDRLLAITGDIGARGIIAAEPESVLLVEIDRQDVFRDIDTPADLARMETLFQKSRQVSHQAREDHQDDHA